ncbi:Tir chaperone protein (CesT) family protein [Succinivibrio dextrinosolvens]|jgi:hypothetical protein|uniref:type III secretion system chaperone n=1 Tax=Succinivibrio dextrinosolvens TaxID=83771 RepID=UPI0008E7DBA4|nr:type III secretion system chaperone [Succinivibrio dextrinosolvens]SFS73762.1 Tir chaperone protein (CesT) family protein [Succinivibrio dextrinosolvens]
MSELNELVTNFKKEHDECEINLQDNGYSATISLGPMEMKLLIQPGSQMLVIQVPVGILPKTDREEFMMSLLDANDFFAGTNGFTLGINKEAEIVTLQTVWNISYLSQEYFSNLVENTFIEGTSWLEKFSLEKTDNETSDKTTSETPASTGLPNGPEQWLKI